MTYDIIGDIHGQVGKLKALLAFMGYHHHQGAWRHPTRTALFVGDFVDRGPGQIETLRLVRDMVEAGSAQAILGNHEFNAIAFHTLGPDGLRHLRERNSKNRHQHDRFLQEVGEDSVEHQYWVNWFLSLPLWLENDHLRVVHACWHPHHMAVLEPWLNVDNTLTLDAVKVASEKGHPAYEAVEVLCKGLEVDLPLGVQYADQQGVSRTRTRIKWWDETANTYRASALLPPSVSELLPADPLPASALVTYDQVKPVFFGHYWFQGAPAILSPQMCCVDYSAALADEPLVAYRFDGQPVLSNNCFVSTAAPPAPRSARL